MTIDGFIDGSLQAFGLLCVLLLWAVILWVAFCAVATIVAAVRRRRP